MALYRQLQLSFWREAFVMDDVVHSNYNCTQRLYILTATMCSSIINLFKNN
ncbi:hypothetical protein CLHOM_25080 [Clostridium homopropionicum DSM 5847]|uniref:Uncharacterized protein n=1 Tax=Clostridium homopropionicum DSM 5847 TaxID=1121318 RepID=A0A0L6Z829_9CLOT|nr:hypothetical protein [Clostridium homopropionicum]KOA19127.1 hypothetical protein CLHOM_25080 [Clostridium homopropionicum DSM 5847]SFG84431.1 hypothetical protein SAMN04488501_11946 [Clostridium homopropionicum]